MGDALNPQEISEMCLPTTTKSAGFEESFEHPPPEILYAIFERTIPPNSLVDLTASFSPNSLWCKVLQQKLSLVNVCRAWYHTGLPFLYEEVSIRRIYQLGNLIRTLECSDYSIPKNLIKSISVRCFVPHSLDGLFEIQLARIFLLCPKITSFSYISPCYPPSLSTLRSLPSTLTHLRLGEGINPMVLQEVLAAASTSLVSLSICVPNLNSAKKEILFPFLERLSCTVRAKAIRIQDINQLASTWKIPLLQYFTLHLTTRISLRSGDILDVDVLMPFFQLHGANLKFFQIHPEYWDYKVARVISIKGILASCPSLEHLVLPPATILPISHHRLEWIDIWDTHDSCANSRKLLRTCFSRRELPSLKGVRTLSAFIVYFADLPMFFPPHLVETAADAFKVQFLDLDVRHDVGEIHSPDKQWGDNTDEEDSCDGEGIADGGDATDGEDTADEEDSDYKSSDESSTDDDTDSDSDASLDWELDSEEDFHITGDAKMDLLHPDNSSDTQPHAAYP